MNIKKINLTNFKAYQSQTFELSKLSVFCGSNSVGKSTAIQALCIFFQSKFNDSDTLKINGDLVTIGEISDVHNHSNRNDDQLIIGIDFNQISLQWGYTTPKQRDEASLNELRLINTRSPSITNFLLNNNFKIQYLSADRFGPKDNFPLSQHAFHSNWLGTKGEFTIEVLQRLIEVKTERFNDVNDQRKHPAARSIDKFVSIEAWMQEIAPGYTITPQTIGKANVAFNTITPPNGMQTRSINVGYGYSYTLSVVTALILASAGDIVIIESPEAHLHPRGQSYLGRLILLTALANVQVIIETHSDHVLNGIRLATRLSDNHTDDLAKVFFVKNENSQTNVDILPIGAKGDLPSWPAGFFDQQALDIRSIISGVSIS
ncbi:AAA family ATPase [Methylotenera mobilis]|uniref:DUF3696 domain-containing protein n=1 Tax=Methylotenera mobilis (strain JLW8 / ATCC BAA-1282 / DSM 17540) TaxID=583345 RepID=C6WTZ5_METML|nr:DUF3696 domain-containing protein [Methylotenera mobilis]ACT47394.1 conserved hypothetical protein, putative P-loop containing nucleoside triphosphate hydrolase [Methylotenera mobilis JLW8]